jgi:hypothetical protein
MHKIILFILLLFSCTQFNNNQQNTQIKPIDLGVNSDLIGNWVGIRSHRMIDGRDEFHELSEENAAKYLNQYIVITDSSFTTPINKSNCYLAKIDVTKTTCNELLSFETTRAKPPLPYTLYDSIIIYDFSLKCQNQQSFYFIIKINNNFFLDLGNYWIELQKIL